MSLETRQSVKILLINDVKKLLLIRVEDPKTTSIDGTYHGPFWCLVGGGIEPDETIQQAAMRELREEVGLIDKDVEMGPVVWRASFDFVRIGVPTHMEEYFVVVTTKKTAVAPEGLTSWEQEVIKEMVWLSLDEIKKLCEKVYPVSLTKHLPSILAGIYPEKPIVVKAE